jgi:hypothetical protein
VQRRFVVEGDLLTWLDVAAGDKENVVIEYLHVAVGFAGVVYVMSAIPALAAIEAPAIIDSADTESASSGAAISFRVGYFLASVLSYLSPTREMRC